MGDGSPRSSLKQEVYNMEEFQENGQWTGTWPQRPPEYVPIEIPEDPKVSRKHFSRMGWSYFIGAVVIYAAQLITMWLINYLKPEWMLDSNIYMLSSIIPMYLIGMPILILLVKRIPGAAVNKRRMKTGSFLIAVIMCFALVYLSNILGNIVTMIISLLKGGLVQNEVFNVTSNVSMWVIFFYMVLCAPLMEEYVFRKLIVDRTVRYGQGVAVVLSGLMFGLFHGNLNQFAYAFTLGVFLAFLYVKTGNLKITIALHMMINFVGGMVTTWLTRIVDMDEYMQIMLGGDQQAAMNYMLEHMTGWILYVVFIGFVLCVIIAGGILWIVSLVKKKFTLAKGVVSIPKGKRFSTVILNVGMIFYSIFWIGMIILQLFM